MKDKASIILGPIIGGLSHERVNLWARADGPSTLYAWLGTRKDLSDSKRRGRVKLAAASGCAGIVPVDKLKPETTYYFALTLEAQQKPPRKSFQSFKTFPLPRARKSFRFAFGSCFRPEQTAPGRAFQHLERNSKQLSFLILEGDQIYADEFDFNGIGRVASNLEDYRAVYHNTWKNRPFRGLLNHLPAFMTLDDHEVDNDWRWLDFEYRQPAIPFYTKWIRWFQGLSRAERELTLERTRAALQAYHEHQVLHAPPLLLPDGTQAYTFEFGACAFFVMDTRTRRVISRKGRSMLGESQFIALTGWLQRVKDEYPVKFIVSSTSFLSHVYLDFTNDRWSGFQIERDRILSAITKEGVEGVYFLTGDLHSAHAISAEAAQKGGKPVPVWEFCSSPFEQNPFVRALLFDRPARSSVLQKQKMHFVVPHINYGIIDVSFDEAGQPAVRFDLIFREFGKWKKQSVQAVP